MTMIALALDVVLDSIRLGYIYKAQKNDSIMCYHCAD